jgi:hypothetical protein
MTRGPTREEYFERELLALEELRDGGHRLPALFEAVKFCQIQGISLPEWAALDVLNLILERYRNPSSDGPGAFSSPKGRFGQDYIHFVRWNVLTGCLRMNGLDSKPSRQRGRPRAGANTDADRYRSALKQSATELRKRSMSCQLKQIEESFDLVEAEHARGSSRFKLDRLSTLALPKAKSSQTPHD